MKYVLYIILTFCPLFLIAETFVVGPVQTYATPNDLYVANVLSDGDTILIDEANYSGQDALAVWQEDDLVILGQGSGPHLMANGEAIWGKGIWVLAGNNITVENIEFSGAEVVDKNGAGIRLDGNGLTVRHCYFHDNQTGILTNNSFEGDIVIEYTEFDNNGAGDGFSHNLYVGHVNSLTFRYNFSHRTKVGHNLKSRANENYILYNRISDDEDGFSSRLIDLPNGGFSIVMGNVLVQGPEALNNNLVGYGLEGLTNTDNRFFVVNNTVVNNKVGFGLFFHIEDGGESALIQNNVLVGSDNVLNGSADLVSNFINEDISAAKFIDASNYNFELDSSSPLIANAQVVSDVLGNSLTPTSIYVHPLNTMERWDDGNIDIGAYEYMDVLSDDHPENAITNIYPNPTNGVLHLEGDNNGKIQLHNMEGRLLKEWGGDDIIDLNFATAGMYILRIQVEELWSNYKIIKGF